MQSYMHLAITCCLVELRQPFIEPSISSINPAIQRIPVACSINPTDLSTEHALAEWNDAAGHIGVHLWINIAQLGGLGSVYANVMSTSGDTHNFASPANLLYTGGYQHVGLNYDKSTGIAKLFYN